VTIAACDELIEVVGTTRACALTGRSKATHYRAIAGPLHGPPAPRPTPPNARSNEERAEILAVLRSPAYADLAVAQVRATLLDDGVYLASQSTMHRVLRECEEHRDRRRQRTHPAKEKPHLVARRALEVWSWDITKLPGPVRGLYFDCYAIIDIFSRYAVGWTVEISEDSTIANTLMAEAIVRQGAGKGQLTLHADRGTSMTSKTVAQLLADLGVTKSHSRLHVSNDNPYIEAHFKTLKYCPAWPGHFDTVKDARAWCEQFFDYYNHIHRSHGVRRLWRDVA
jgi:putative transposase